MQTVLRPAARWAAAWVATASMLASGHAFSATCGPETTYSPISDYSLTFRVCDNSFVGRTGFSNALFPSRNTPRRALGHEPKWLLRAAPAH